MTNERKWGCPVFAMNNEPATLLDAIGYFADEQVCIDTVAAMRWTNGPQCPACSMPAIRQHWLKNQKRWQCRDCGRQYSVRVNTIFEDSAVKLGQWLIAMWMLSNGKYGVSSHQVARCIGVTQKSAWFMLQRIRLAMKHNTILKLAPGDRPAEATDPERRRTGRSESGTAIA